MKKRKLVDLPKPTMELLARCAAVLKPPPALTLSEWADRYRVLSAESSAEPGRWDGFIETIWLWLVSFIQFVCIQIYIEEVLVC